MPFYLELDKEDQPFSIVAQLYTQLPFSYVYIDGTIVMVYLDFKYAGESHSMLSTVMSDGLIINKKRYPVVPCFPWNKYDTEFLEKSKTSTITDLHPIVMNSMYTTRHMWFIPSPPRYLW